MQSESEDFSSVTEGQIKSHMTRTTTLFLSNLDTKLAQLWVARFAQSEDNRAGGFGYADPNIDLGYVRITAISAEIREMFGPLRAGSYFSWSSRRNKHLFSAPEIDACFGWDWFWNFQDLPSVTVNTLEVIGRLVHCVISLGWMHQAPWWY